MKVSTKGIKYIDRSSFEGSLSLLYWSVLMEPLSLSLFRISLDYSWIHFLTMIFFSVYDPSMKDKSLEEEEDDQSRGAEEDHQIPEDSRDFSSLHFFWPESPKDSFLTLFFFWPSIPVFIVHIGEIFANQDPASINMENVIVQINGLRHGFHKSWEQCLFLSFFVSFPSFHIFSLQLTLDLTIIESSSFTTTTIPTGAAACISPIFSPLQKIEGKKLEAFKQVSFVLSLSLSWHLLISLLLLYLLLPDNHQVEGFVEKIFDGGRRSSGLYLEFSGVLQWRFISIFLLLLSVCFTWDVSRRHPLGSGRSSLGRRTQRRRRKRSISSEGYHLLLLLLRYSFFWVTDWHQKIITVRKVFVLASKCWWGIGRGIRSGERWWWR